MLELPLVGVSPALRHHSSGLAEPIWLSSLYMKQWLWLGNLGGIPVTNESQDGRFGGRILWGNKTHTATPYIGYSSFSLFQRTNIEYSECCCSSSNSWMNTYMWCEYGSVTHVGIQHQFPSPAASPPWPPTRVIDCRTHLREPGGR